MILKGSNDCIISTGSLLQSVDSRIPLFSSWTAYFDADYNVLSNDGYVTHWGSRVNQYYVSQATQANRPLIESTWSSSKNAVVFSGSQYLMRNMTDYLCQVPNQAGAGMHDLTVAYQVSENHTAGTTVAAAATFYASGYLNVFGIRLSALNNMKIANQLYQGAPDNYNVTHSGTTNIGVGNERILITTITDGYSRHYINGELESNSPQYFTGITSLTLKTGTAFFVGASSTSLINPWLGRIRRVAIANRALSASEVRTVYEAWDGN